MVLTTDLFAWNTVASSTPTPPPSCCQTLVAYKMKLFLFGGAVLGVAYNDVHSYDIERGTWQYEETRNSEVATPRMSHTAVLYENKMIVFGGMDLSMIHADLLELDLDTLVWRSLPCTSSAHPGCRRSHAAVVYEGRMYITMGLPAQRSPDLWSYDFTTSEWVNHPTTQRFGIPPLCVHGHSACVIRDTMYLFGGCAQQPYGPAPGNQQSLYFNTLYKYEFRSNVWSEVLTTPSPRPSPRYSHVMVVVGNRLVVHGGDTMNCTKYFGDLWTVDVAGEDHAAPDEDSPRHVPLLRANNTSQRSQNTSAGGSPVVDAMVTLMGRPQTPVNRPRSWVAHHNTGPLKPCPRSGHSATVHGGRLFVFGGEAPGDATTVLYSCQLYAFPLSLSTSLPLSDLCCRWLSRSLTTVDYDELSEILPLQARRAIDTYAPRGTKEILCPHHL